MKRFVDILLALFKIVVMRVSLLFVPLKKNKFFCISMLGKNYGDNIKPLADYINSKEGTEVVWAFNDALYGKVECEYKNVKMYSWAYYYQLLTSKYILTNQYVYDLPLTKSKGQIVLQTWHGTALKRIGNLIGQEEAELFHKLFSSYCHFILRKKTDIFISGSRYMTDIYQRAFGYKQTIYEVGTPRNDLFFYTNPELELHLKEMFHVPQENGILLYAPTFRSDKSCEYYNLNLTELSASLTKVTGKNYSLFIRLHPNMLKQATTVMEQMPPNVIDVSFYPDMQELLYVTDVLVSDYSSSIFDFMYLKRPIVLYVPDLERYDRGFCFDINDVPAIFISDNKKIESAVSHFDLMRYKKEQQIFLGKIGSVETGHATEDVYKLLMSYGKC